MTTVVSFELAKLLKEKGFDIPTFYYYEDEKLVEPYLENGSSSDVEFRVDLSDLKEHFNKWSKRISAPTIAEVVMWLYDKHGIWIWVGCRLLENGTNTTIFIPQGRTIPPTKKDGFVVDIIPYTPKGSPTEAYEAAIEYTLKNLM